MTISKFYSPMRGEDAVSCKVDGAGRTSLPVGLLAPHALIANYMYNLAIDLGSGICLLGINHNVPPALDPYNVAEPGGELDENGLPVRQSASV